MAKEDLSSLSDDGKELHFLIKSQKELQLQVNELQQENFDLKSQKDLLLLRYDDLKEKIMDVLEQS